MAKSKVNPGGSLLRKKKKKKKSATRNSDIIHGRVTGSDYCSNRLHLQIFGISNNVRLIFVINTESSLLSLCQSSFCLLQLLSDLYTVCRLYVAILPH